MDNKQIYKKTLCFSLRRMLWDFLAFIVLAGFCTAGFLLMNQPNSDGGGLIGLGIGLVIGIIAVVIILRYVSYTYKAGQIAMMTRAVTERELPEDVLKAGKAAVKERFATVALFFAATRIIKGIFNQIGRGLTAVGQSVGGDTGSNIASAINSIIQVVIAYLCDCCLGWVFYRKEQKAAKATCEGAVLFFRHGKTLAKNLGRVFGIGLLSLLLIGGAFFGLFFLIFSQFPATFEKLFAEFGEVVLDDGVTLAQKIGSPDTLLLIAAGIAAVILWSILHSVFVRPFVLVGVLRNYLESGMNDIPTEASFRMLDSKSGKFKKLHAEAV